MAPPQSPPRHPAPPQRPFVLGIETSCDETAAAVVAADRSILSNVILSQTALHAVHGGVVPEIAARAHLDHIDRIVTQALEQASLSLNDLDAVAATVGPGLIGGLIVGAMTGKAIALAAGLPFIAVNHLEGHALSARLAPGVAYPYLLLLVSGGHCQLLVVEGLGTYHRLGGTIDDAAGEAFDKTAKLLGLGYPGGPALERSAVTGDPRRFALPQPLVGRPGCDFSFSGLKTAVRQLVERLGSDATARDVADISAAFQAAVAAVLVDRTRHALAMADERGLRPTALVVAGGVAANQLIRRRLTELAAAHGLALAAPPPALCTDNAAMIAWAGLEHFRAGHVDRLDVAARPRWPLDPRVA
ncbi:MAG: tRNA (adenosine(37)-N6)-threonylcarbamoyltransferase complex transferase subunit TsaD [Phreatobacter sp.]|uniref:tRNA (adenosine(37)-N6)-threonylcarbamoyltransferase complex transferase subunit TsaD n=1 Tax=Phreatobacter sp. TaxID=1966341 RepID=UPI001A531E3E|nr:tRNA (adenosine(37)-N6)-threonylcarbamoyltransferase complex transferase subunit TsaD [Phreatobacter sp.]MBL8567994.1 tRNA (adenosine(37)-N6)-threonylcarbamoyltransferase complex transferase subunit TsaD [Phreatobacter sp.]